MKKICSLALIILQLMFSMPALAQDYLLGPGDVIALNVWGYDEFNLKEVVIRPDGKVSIPLVGEIMAQGLSAAELTGKIAKGLREYLRKPDVTVNIVKFRTTRVYVLGEVNKPGLVELEKSHNLLDAIGAVGGYTKYAAKKQVFIIRHLGGGKLQTKPLKANLYKLLKKADMSQNYALGDGDVVYLSNNGKISFTQDILPFISAGYYLDRIGKD